MKKIALLSAALVIVSASAASATTGSILNSRHDMRQWNQESGNGTAEVCIYCHTPHNAKINVPLWNRNNPSATTWQLYNASATITSATKNSSISSDSISLFCMSCHDGKTALGDLKNNNPYYNSWTNTATGQFGNGHSGSGGLKVAGVYARIGSSNGANDGGYDLSNTHPIGFDFIAAQAEDKGLRDYDTIMGRFATLDTSKSTPQSFLYNRPSASGTGKVWFECASCHRVHDPGPSGNFLRLENQASQLCLACHDK